ncbi:type II secretion system F family protein, partial [Verrucomicrobiota bacterium]
MPVFVYVARSRSGERVEGEVDAVDRRTALTQIERQGFVPITVDEKTAAVTAEKKIKIDWKNLFSWRGRDKMPARDMLIFTTELSDLLSSGMKLGNALNTLSRHRTNQSYDKIVKTLRDDIIRGTSLSQAMAQFPETFPSLYVSLIRAGEAAGNLAEIMQRIVLHYERMQDAKEKVVMALVYPGIVITVGIGILIFSMVFVIPRFSMIFRDLGGTLPLP